MSSYYAFWLTPLRHTIPVWSSYTLPDFILILSKTLQGLLLKLTIIFTSWLHRASTILKPFYYQPMHITLKNAEILKHSKLNKNAPTCFGLHRNHLQGAKVSAWLKITRLVNTFTQCTIHTPYRSQYAAIALTTPCISFTQILLNKRVIFSQALTLAPLRWFLCKPKHVEAFLSNLECFNNSAFINVVCISW